MTEQVLDTSEYLDHPHAGELLGWLADHPKRTAIDMWGSHLANDMRYNAAGFKKVAGEFEIIRYPESFLRLSHVTKPPKTLGGVYQGDKLARIRSYIDHVWTTGETHLSTRIPIREDVRRLNIHNIRILFAIFERSEVAAVLSVLSPVSIDLALATNSEMLDIPNFVKSDNDLSFRLCRELYKAEIIGNMPTAQALCVAVDTPLRTLYRVIAMLKDEGVILEKADPEDGRRRLFELTGDGRCRTVTALRRQTG